MGLGKKIVKSFREGFLVSRITLLRSLGNSETMSEYVFYTVSRSVVGELESVLLEERAREYRFLVKSVTENVFWRFK